MYLTLIVRLLFVIHHCDSELQWYLGTSDGLTSELTSILIVDDESPSFSRRLLCFSRCD